MGINVLSLFDGISCGQIALERAGIEVDNYYASEIDKYAIQVTQKNYPNTKQLGDVTKLMHINWLNPKIDLLIGGSPCQDLSGLKNKDGLSGEKSKLFFEYVRILNEIKKVNPNVKFLLENVRMKPEYKDTISDLLGVEPVIINSSLVSAQDRKRLYWTNIEGFIIPTDRNILLQDVLTNGVAHRKKSKTLRVGGRGSKDRHEWDIADISGRTYNLKEMERLQTLPEGYTKHIPKNHAFKAIGNGWTVDVIVEFFKCIKNPAV